MQKPAEIAARLKALRGALTQEEFAAKIGVSFRTYQYYEGGIRSPKWKVLSKIAELCGVTVDWILTGESIVTDRIAESPALYLDEETRKIIGMLKDMDQEARRDVLKYAEEKKQAAAWRREKGLKEG